VPRADQLLQRQAGLPSRTIAHRLITGGKVEVLIDQQWQPLHKPGLKLSDDTPLRLLDQSELQYVSRGGLKLAGALAHCGMSVRGHRVLDVGQSTGGFTDALLQAGAQHVVGIDVGHGQLAPALRQDPRVTCLENINARALPTAMAVECRPAQGFSRMVMDVSFISQRQVLAPILTLSAANTELLMLVKPQFEVGKAHVGKGGVVRDESQLHKTQTMIIDHYQELGLSVHDYFDSPIQGGDGNREYFIFASRTG
jgi:23S rRNA (cytidine1920-2'-O)/16S rRNA (cytidine1409-2'-O)-methyltransferase